MVIFSGKNHVCTVGFWDPVLDCLSTWFSFDAWSWGLWSPSRSTPLNLKSSWKRSWFPDSWFKTCESRPRACSKIDYKISPSSLAYDPLRYFLKIFLSMDCGLAKGAKWRKHGHHLLMNLKTRKSISDTEGRNTRRSFRPKVSPNPGKTKET